MTVYINFDHPGTCLNDGGDSGWLMLDDTESEKDRPAYASWPFYANPDDAESLPYTWWTWENPDEPLENITLSPSLMLERDDPNTFHIFIRSGEIQHCGDCQCGCN